MKFDLTPEIILGSKQQHAYLMARSILFVISFGLALYLAISVLFPTRYFYFSFLNPESTKNTIIRPRNAQNIFLNRGQVGSEESFKFDAALPGNYSTAVVEFSLNKKSASISGGQLSARKGFQSFFYPEGEPNNFKIVKAAGLPLSSGSLVAYGPSAYVVSGEKIAPIDSVETFEAQGYNWDDLKNTSPDELAYYKKDKLFTLSSPHPDGTVLATDDGKYYQIQNGQKHLLVDNNVPGLLENSPISVSSKSLNFTKTCELKKKTFSLRTYSCRISIAELRNISGMDYEFSASLGNNVKIDFINVYFKNEWSVENLKIRISEILTRVKKNYAGEI